MLLCKKQYSGCNYRIFKLVDVKKNKVIETINISDHSFGVVSDGQFVVISNDQKSTSVNLDDMTHTILEGVTAKSISLFKGISKGRYMVKLTIAKSTAIKVMDNHYVIQTR